MKLGICISTLLLAGLLVGCKTTKPETMGNLDRPLEMESFYLPSPDASRVLSVTTNGVTSAEVLVETQRVAVKEGGPKETLKKFGEVYAFSPNFFVVHREEPTRIRLWNLQPDDNHTFMLIDPHSQVLMSVLLRPLSETSYIFTFHEEGLFNFVCALHPPAMHGQVLVLPPKTAVK